jgi:hypothetical protein
MSDVEDPEAFGCLADKTGNRFARSVALYARWESAPVRPIPRSSS